MALVGYESSDSETSDVEHSDWNLRLTQTNQRKCELGAYDQVEPEYKMRIPKSVKNPPAIPDLVISKSKSGKLLLSVPSLDPLGSSSSDSDSEAFDRNSKKKQRPLDLSGSASASKGLLALLPPTRASCFRDIPKPTLLTPHQLLVKRTPSAAPAVQSSSHVTIEKEEEWEDTNESHEDEVGEAEAETFATPSSFFSFYQPSAEDPLAVAGVRAEAANAINKSKLPTSPEVPSTNPDEHVTLTSSYPSSAQSVSRSAPRPPPLCVIDPDVLKECEIPKKDVDSEDAADSVEIECWTEETFVPGPERKRARLAQPGIRSLPVMDLLQSSNQQIREVSQTDLTVGADIELMKSVTADESQYVSQRVKAENDPGVLAHRKHQITWLAHQAQENEPDLERRWAEARRNRASNRAKYGF